MARIDTGLVDVLLAVRRILIQNVADATDPNCYVSLDPTKAKNARNGDFFYVVSPFDGRFDSGMIDGGGQNQVSTDSQIAVTICSIQNLDRPGEDESFLVHDDLGLLTRFDSVLKLFTAMDLTDEFGNDITLEPIIPDSYNIGRERERPLGWIQLVMTVKFDWDLSAS